MIFTYGHIFSGLQGVLTPFRLAPQEDRFILDRQEHFCQYYICKKQNLILKKWDLKSSIILLT